MRNMTFKNIIIGAILIVAYCLAWYYVSSPSGQKQVDRILNSDNVMYAQQRTLWQGR